MTGSKFPLAVKMVMIDLDGTLTDNYLGIARSILHALERLGADAPDEATLRRCVGPPLRVSFAALLGELTHAISLALAFLHELLEADQQKVSLELRKPRP